MPAKRTKEQFDAEVVNLERELNIHFIDDFSTYKNNSSRLKYICNRCGSIRESSWFNLMRFHGCKTCAENQKGEKRKFTKEQFNSACEEILAKHKIQIVEPYENLIKVEIPLMAECVVCGKRFRYRLSMRGKVGCKYCSKKAKMDREEYESFISECHRNGLEISETYDEYVNTKQKLTVTCRKCGEVFLRGFDGFRTRKFCSFCGPSAKIRSESWKNKMVETAKENGFILISPLSNPSDKHQFRCKKCGQIIEKTLYSVEKSTGCPICKKVNGLLEFQFNECVDTIRENNKIDVLTPYSEYQGNLLRLNCKCLVCGKEIHPNLNNLMRGAGCSECRRSMVSSAQEVEIVEMISKYLPDLVTEQNRRGVLGRQEIDVFVPSLNVGVEYHGLYWHAETEKDKRYHLEKYLSAKKAGIRLIQVFGDEWEQRKDVVSSVVLGALGYSEKRVDARKCEVLWLSDLNKNEFVEFFEKNHISGNVRFFDAVGLWFDGALVQAVSFRRPFVKKYGDVIEIARSCSLLLSRVRGGFSKLMSAATKKYRNETFLTYADLRFGDGKVYEKCGFEQVGTTPPDYSYTDFQNRFNRFQFRAQNGKTEKQVAEEAGVVKIFGVGSKIFLLRPAKNPL